MTSRKTIDQITSDQYDQLYNDLAAAQTLAARAAGQRDRLTHRIHNLADQWAITRPDAAAELRELLTLEERASTAGTEGADADTTSRVFAALHRSAERDVTRVIGLYEQWVKAGPPPLGVSLARWWDARLVELHDAILPAAGEPPRTTPNTPPTSLEAS